MQTLVKPDGGGGGKGGPSLLKRLHAWWEGYDLPDAPKVRADSAADATDAAPPPPPVPEWNGGRQELVQMLWGNGFNIPGEEDYILNLVKPFGLTRENTMVEIGAGLGGGARLVAQKVGTYVEGFDLNEDLAKRANEFALIKGLEKKAKVRAFHPETLELRPAYYDAALIRETLMAVADKAMLIEKVLISLKPRSSIVISDFFLPNGEPGPAAAAALEAENRENYPSDVEVVVGAMENLGVEVRIDANETLSYAENVRMAWAQVAHRLAASPVSDEISDALMRETELWRLRNEAFEAEELQVRRIVGFKKSEIV